MLNQIMDTLLLCICTFLPCLYLYRLLFSNPSSPAGNPPPGPAPLPIVGNLLKLSARPNESLADLAAAFGPVMTLQLGRVTTVVITSAAAAKEALQKNDQAVAGRCLPDGVRVAEYPGSSMVWRQANQGWRNLRLLCSKWIFSSARLDAGRGLREKKVRQLVELVGRRTSPVNVGTIAFATMLNMISNTVFSVDLVDVTSESAQEFKDLVWSIMEEVGKPNLADYYPFLRALDPQGVRRKTSGYVKKLLDVFDGLIRVRLVERAGPKYEKKEDFVEALLDLKEKGEATQISTHEMKCLFLVRDHFIL